MDEKMENMGEAIRADMADVHFTPFMKEEVLENIHGKKRMPALKRTLVLVCALLMVALLGVAAAGGVDVFGIMRTSQKDDYVFDHSIYERMGENVRFFQNEVWEIPAGGDYPGYTVVFDQAYYDGQYLMIGYHRLGIDADEIRVYDVPVEVDKENAHASGSLVDYYHLLVMQYPEKELARRPWTAVKYKTFIDGMAEGIEGFWSGFTKEDRENDILYVLLQYDLSQKPELQNLDEITVVFSASHQRNMMLVEEDTYYQIFDTMGTVAAYELVIPRTAESEYVSLSGRDPENMDIQAITNRGFSMSVRGEVGSDDIRLRVYLFAGNDAEVPFNWAKKWGSSDSETRDVVYTCELYVNGQVQKLLMNENLRLDAYNFQEVEFTFSRPSGDLNEILLVPVYTLSGAHVEEAIRLK